MEVPIEKDYYPKLHAMLNGGGEAETSSEGKTDNLLSFEAKNALAGLKALEKACPGMKPPEEIAGGVRYLVEQYKAVLANEKKALDPVGLLQLRYRGVRHAPHQPTACASPPARLSA